MWVKAFSISRSGLRTLKRHFPGNISSLHGLFSPHKHIWKQIHRGRQTRTHRCIFAFSLPKAKLHSLWVADGVRKGEGSSFSSVKQTDWFVEVRVTSKEGGRCERDSLRAYSFGVLNRDRSFSPIREGQNYFHGYETFDKHTLYFLEIENGFVASSFFYPILCPSTSRKDIQRKLREKCKATWGKLKFLLKKKQLAKF